MHTHTRHLIAAHALALALLAVSSALQPFSLSAFSAPASTLWRDPAQPLATRVADLVQQLTLKEKISQISCNPLAIPRLGIPAYSHRNECLHGIMGTDSPSTNFPEPIGLAATWNAPLIKQMADAIATEARAKYYDYTAKHNGNVGERYGLTFYSPNINIFRDPRWGRGQETYGEDPFLTSQMGVAFITGLQGDNPNYMKILACAKHFAVHSGPELNRHKWNVEPSERDLYETYLPAFEAAVREGHVGSFMNAYSSLYGKPCAASPFLIQDLLRGQWGFDGCVFSDGGGIWDIYDGHHYRPTPEECVAEALNAGCDVASGNVQDNQSHLEPDVAFKVKERRPRSGGQAFNMLQVSLEKNLTTMSEIDRAVRNELTTRFRTGMFDPRSMDPWAGITMADCDSPAHRALATKIAEQSIVLLKNDPFPNGAAAPSDNPQSAFRNPHSLLPLDRAKYKRIAVIGPNADSKEMLKGNYHGKPSVTVTILQGIKNLAGAGIEVVYARGCPETLKKDHANATRKVDTDKTLALAKSADLVIFVSGINSNLEKEEAYGDNYNWEGFDHGDRTAIELPPVQTTLIKQLHALGKPVVLVNCSGCAMAMPWEAENLPALVQAWYPGQDGGTAVARVLFGEVNPAGRLPVTFYKSTADLPGFSDYSMANRTYKYFTGVPLYAFGHGLSYTTFAYENASLDKTTFAPTDTIKLTFDLKNTGARDGDEVPQVYFRHVNSPHSQSHPRQALCGFTRVALEKNGSKQVTIEIPISRLRYYDTEAKRYAIESGAYELLLAAASDDIRATLPFAVK